MADQFQTTRWSVVLSAARGGEGSRESLEWLCDRYWYPLYAFVRRRGHDADSAKDITQAFFLSFLDQNSLRAVDPDMGKFRAYLLGSMKHFLANEADRENALKRRTDHPSFRVDLDGAEAKFAIDTTTPLGPEELFESRWARSVLDRAVRRLREEHERAGKGELFQKLRPHLTSGEPGADLTTDELGMSQGAFRVAVHRMRKRLGFLLRDEVAQTVADPAQVDDELRSLLQAAARNA